MKSKAKLKKKIRSRMNNGKMEAERMEGLISKDVMAIKTGQKKYVNKNIKGLSKRIKKAQGKDMIIKQIPRIRRMRRATRVCGCY
jgi:hypothetical protein